MEYNFKYTGKFQTENGEFIHDLQIRYHVFGTALDKAKKIIWIFHGFSANSDVSVWWQEMLINNSFINLDQDCVICPNILGSCYGTTGPNSINPVNGKPYRLDFPRITVRDMAKAQDILRQSLKIEKIDIALGASMGGFIALELAYELGNKIENLILIASTAKVSPWFIALNEVQRNAISADFSGGKIKSSLQGLKAARAIALISYRSYASYNLKFADENDETQDYKCITYLDYNTESFAERFDSFSYLTLSYALDTHNIARNRESISSALAEIISRTLVIGISSDILLPTNEQKQLSELLPNCIYKELDAGHGHDSFLIETKKLVDIIKAFLEDNNE